MQEVRTGVYQIVIMSPASFRRGPFTKILQDGRFQKKLRRLVFDEAHRIVDWAGELQPAYQVDRLRSLQYSLPKHVKLVFCSETLPVHLYDALMLIFFISSNEVDMIRLSVDRPNVMLVLRKIRHSFASYHDLACLLPPNSSTPPLPFLVFFDNYEEARYSALFLRSRLRKEEDWVKVKWYHDVMSAEYLHEELEALAQGKRWCLCCIDDAPGMVRCSPGILV